MIRVGIIGSASFTGGELLRLLSRHPEVKVTCLESSSNAGKKVFQVHRQLLGLYDLTLQTYNRDQIKSECDVVFICRSSGGSMKFIHDLYDENDNLKIIDLGGDFRLQDVSLYPKWYKFDHICPDLVKKAVFGLSEIHTDAIKKAKLLSNPGCYATSILLALIPLIAEKYVVLDSIKVTSYSGMSGAGKTHKEGFNLFMDAYGNARPYRVGTHQHTPEIEGQLNIFSDNDIKITFVPHVMPIDRGILTEIWCSPQSSYQFESLMEVYLKYYQNRPFIRLRQQGDYPQVADVNYTNFCDISWDYDARTNSLIIFSAEDNAIKGASGQAIQNMNLMFGFPETTGLPGFCA